MEPDQNDGLGLARESPFKMANPPPLPHSDRVNQGEDGPGHDLRNQGPNVAGAQLGIELVDGSLVELGGCALAESAEVGIAIAGVATDPPGQLLGRALAQAEADRRGPVLDEPGQPALSQ